MTQLTYLLIGSLSLLCFLLSPAVQGIDPYLDDLVVWGLLIYLSLRFLQHLGVYPQFGEEEPGDFSHLHRLGGP